MASPLDMLEEAVKSKLPVLVAMRNNKKIYGYVKAFDKHFNMLMVEATEYWSEVPEHLVGQPGAEKTLMNRRLPKLVVRGDGVVLVVNNPSKVYIDRITA